MTVYDFDCIYEGDCTLEFYKFARKKNPRVLLYALRQLFGYFLYIIGVYSRGRANEAFHSYLRALKNVPALIEAFWNSRLCNVHAWYLAQKQTDDVIVSAAPEFIVRPACRRLGLKNVAATKLDVANGRSLSAYNYGGEKARRLRSEFGEESVGAFYSGSLADAPAAALAQRAFYVNNGAPVPWEEYRLPAKKRARSLLCCREFVMYAVVCCVSALCGAFLVQALCLAMAATVAYATGFVLAVMLAFFMAALLAFKTRLTLERMFRFCLCYAPLFIAQGVAALALDGASGVTPVAVYAAVTAAGVLVTYCLMRRFVFPPAQAAF